MDYFMLYSFVIGLALWIIITIIYIAMDNFIDGLADGSIVAGIVFMLCIAVGVGGSLVTVNLDTKKSFDFERDNYEYTSKDYVETIISETNCNPDDILEINTFDAYFRRFFISQIASATVTDKTLYIQDSEDNPYIVIGKLYYNKGKYHVLEVHY